MDNLLMQYDELPECYGGGHASYHMMKNVFINDKKDFVIIHTGCINKIIYRNKVFRYVDKWGNNGIAHACKSVIKDADEFFEKGQQLEIKHPKASTRYTDKIFIANMLKNGISKFLEIDIKACYWTIAFKKGIISEKVYKKYLNQKMLRLIAIGNLNKNTLIKKYKNGKGVLRKIILNTNKPVWEYVVSEAWGVFNELNELLNNQVFMFKTDCFYVLPGNKRETINYIKKQEFRYTINELEIINYNGCEMLCKLSGKDKEIKRIIVGYIKY